MRAHAGKGWKEGSEVSCLAGTRFSRVEIPTNEGRREVWAISGGILRLFLGVFSILIFFNSLSLSRQTSVKWLGGGAYAYEAGPS